MFVGRFEGRKKISIDDTRNDFLRWKEDSETRPTFCQREAFHKIFQLVVAVF